jgi:threonine-phosphate decarboxylase
MLYLEHGGDHLGFTAEYGREPLDFSANVNPLGTPDSVKQAVRASADVADRYPDPLCRTLRDAIAAHANTTAILPSQIVCGAGAADVIWRVIVASRPQNALIVVPTFSEYAAALNAVGCNVLTHALSETDGFQLTETVLPKLTRNVDMFFLCNPNNPTGLTLERSLLLQILQRCHKNGTLLVMDECFNDFLPDPQAHSLIGKIAEFENLLILKAFTKLYGMAGIRLGYGISSNTALLEHIRLAGQPWAVSAAAQSAGIYALDESDFVTRTRTLLADEKAFLLTELAAFNAQYPANVAIEIIGSAANYIFFKCTNEYLAAELRQAGILIRDCSNFEGLGRGYFRIAVKAHADNVKLISALSTNLSKTATKTGELR